MTFSMQLSDDVIEVRDWVHKFSADVIRPAAAEWDEREETPWPVIQEAAKVGLYSPDFFAQQAAEPVCEIIFVDMNTSSTAPVRPHRMSRPWRGARYLRSVSSGQNAMLDR